MTSWDEETERIIFLSKNGGNADELNHQLTTVYYPDEQISSYHPPLMTTTPMNGKQNTATSSVETSMALKSTVLPPNHKKYYSQVMPHNRNNIESDHVRKSKTKSSETELKSRMFFSNDDDDDDDVDAENNNNANVDYDDLQKVNSIQDILEQGYNYDYDNEFSGLISSSMPFSRGMKVEGTYRREKKKRDFVNSIETSNSESIPIRDYQNDPFSKFKPKSPNEVNLLATNQQMKYTPYALNKPRPLTTATTFNPYYNEYFDPHDPNSIYHQVIAANNLNRDITPRANSRFEKPIQQIKKQKPFSLMLDVYPMPDDEQQSSSTLTSSAAASAATIRNTPYNQFKRPIHYPVNTNAINHLQHSYYSPIKFPQLQQYRIPYASNVNYNNNPNDGYFRKLMLNRIGPQIYPPILRQQSTYSPIDLTNPNTPSQITVHLNLYPNRKKSQARNVEIIDMGDPTESVFDAATTSFKRNENNENFTDLNQQETQSNGKYYIPPFSAIKINSLQPQFDLNVTHPFDMNLFNHDMNEEQQIAVLTKSKPFQITKDLITESSFDINTEQNHRNSSEDNIKTTSIVETDSKIVRFPN